MAEGGSSLILAREASDDNLLKNVEVRLATAPVAMRSFSNILVGLYHSNQVSSTTDEGREFNALRDATKKDACMYTKGALPLATSAVGKLKDFLENYDDFTFDEWKESLEDIREDVSGFKKISEEIVKIHQNIMTGLKKKEEQAEVMVGKFQHLKKQYERRRDEARKKAGRANELKFVHFVPIWGLIQAAQDLKDSNDAHATEVAALANLNTSDKAILAVTTGMIPALKAFFDGVSAVAGFFNVIGDDLANLKTDKEKELHYKKYQKKAKRIVQHCNGFIGSIPTVKAYLDAIPYSQNDLNYVDQWLATTKKEIEENFRKNKLAAWSDKKQILGVMSETAAEAWKYIFAQKGIAIKK